VLQRQLAELGSPAAPGVASAAAADEAAAAATAATAASVNAAAAADAAERALADAEREDFGGGRGAQTGAIFLAVSRGKASEGLDFADDFCRTVVSVGLPLPPYFDPNVVSKRKYEEDRAPGAGRKWYDAQAYRALNQGVGRALRHKNDFGAIIFLESRFRNQSYVDNLAKWLRGVVNRDATLGGGGLRDLAVFFVHSSFHPPPLAEAPLERGTDGGCGCPCPFCQRSCSRGPPSAGSALSAPPKVLPLPVLPSPSLPSPSLPSPSPPPSPLPASQFSRAAAAPPPPAPPPPMPPASARRAAGRGVEVSIYDDDVDEEPSGAVL